MECASLLISFFGQRMGFKGTWIPGLEDRAAGCVNAVLPKDYSWSARQILPCSSVLLLMIVLVSSYSSRKISLLLVRVASKSSASKTSAQRTPL